MNYHKDQNLNQWAEMLNSIYGSTSNYSKSEYEILAHLTEVTGAFGKYMFKRQQPEKAIVFVPKMFAWSLALLTKVERGSADLENIILTKFPRVCSYCCSAPCECNKAEKSPINPERVRELFLRDSLKQRRSLDDFQQMFRTIYEQSWSQFETLSDNEKILSVPNAIYVRLVEELSEVAEAVRFFHLYSYNFENELADYLAWWFALVSTMHIAFGYDRKMFLAADLVWPAYPGHCQICMLPICDCRPGPVREILSKPSLTNLTTIDGLTQANNRASFDQDINDIKAGNFPIPAPMSCIRVDVDDFKMVNDSYSHSMGDEALKYLVTIMRQKIRSRDRLYRVGGDEFAILCPDLSELEAKGMMIRVASALHAKPLFGRIGRGQPNAQIRLTLSIGIVECRDISLLNKSFDAADDAAIQSKKLGKDQITIAQMPR